ncbi:MAG: hypothetical protein R2932_48475 [Caldilineaceae bacterium]
MPMVVDPVIWAIRILHVIAFSVEVFIRREFGERYDWMGPFFRDAHPTQHCHHGVPYSLLPAAYRRRYLPRMSGLFWYGFIIMTGYHMLRIWQRNRQGHCPAQPVARD